MSRNNKNKKRALKALLVIIAILLIICTFFPLHSFFPICNSTNFCCRLNDMVFTFFGWQPVCRGVSSYGSFWAGFAEWLAHLLGIRTDEATGGSIINESAGPGADDMTGTPCGDAMFPACSGDCISEDGFVAICEPEIDLNDDSAYCTCRYYDEDVPIRWIDATDDLIYSGEDACIDSVFPCGGVCPFNKILTGVCSTIGGECHCHYYVPCYSSWPECGGYCSTGYACISHEDYCICSATGGGGGDDGGGQQPS